MKQRLPRFLNSILFCFAGLHVSYNFLSVRRFFLVFKKIPIAIFLMMVTVSLHAQPFMEASGGTISIDGDYKVHTFNSSQVFSVTTLGNGVVKILVVAGGGGGGRGRGAGGGAGGLLYNSTYTISALNYNVTVGAGGAGGSVNLADGSNGSNSIFNDQVSIGGGGGGGEGYLGSYVGHPGGSGGGSGAVSNAGGTATTGQGNNGGNGGSECSNNDYPAGGGGGAGGVGMAGGVFSACAGGNGGVGTSLSISGSSVYYAGGGAGSYFKDGSAGIGGTGGGGDGGSYSNGYIGKNGVANSGGGGGGGIVTGNATYYDGGDGGSGVVIIRYQFQASAGTSSTDSWKLLGNSGTNPAANFIGTTDQQRLIFKTYGIERVTMLSDGNVGIGTNSPSQKLHVNGNIYSSGTIAVGPIMDWNKITDYSLAVNGTAIFNKVKVKLYTAPWPDYVFHQDYKLPSLDEIEKYIKINQHLPEVPSAAQVEKNGLDVGDNQALLLKKIEELTLLLIEQNKRIKILEQSNIN